MSAVLSTPAALGGAPSRLPARNACCHAPAAAAAGRTRHGRRLTVAVSARKKSAAALVSKQSAPVSTSIPEADLYQAVDPAPLSLPPAAAAVPAGVPSIGGQPWYVVAPIAFMGLIAVLRTAKAAKKKMSQGNRLEERGYKKGGAADEQSYSRAIKGMKKMQYEELSDAQIEAARKRRRREVEKDEMPMDLEQIELPDNHPFAVRRKLAPEEEAQQYNRLHKRRGLSPEDMQRLREQQALADQMDAEGDARDARRARG